MLIKIDRNIPHPSKGPIFVRRPSDGPYTMPRKWPWTEMRVGDSLVAPDRAAARSAHNSFMTHQRTKHSRLPATAYVSMRKQPDGTYRLWLLDREQSSSVDNPS